MKQHTFAQIYNNHCALLYSLAFEISGNEKDAEQILIDTLKEFRRQNLIQRQHPSHCITLVRLLFETYHNQGQPGAGKEVRILKRFEDSPHIYKILCENADFYQYCVDNNLTRPELGLLLRAELNLLRT